MLILLALFCSFNHRVVSTKALSGKHILVPFILIVVAGVIASRQNILAVLVGFLALFFFLKPKQKMIVGTMVVCFGIIVGPFVISKIASDERMSARLSTVTEFEPATRADKYRLANIIQAVEGFQRSPVFGNGPTSFKRNNQFDKVAHSTPFSALYELGLLGLLFLIAIFWNIMRFPFYLRRVLNPHPAAVIFASLMPLIVVQSFFIELLPKAPLFVYFALSIAALQVFKGSHYVHYKKA